MENTDIKEIEKEKRDYLHKRIEFYDKTEQWSAVFIITGIAIFTAKLIEWTSSTNGALKDKDVNHIVWFYPLLCGLLGMIFLRTINFRYKKISIKLSTIYSSDLPSRWGLLGYIIAYFPLLLGGAASLLVNWSPQKPASPLLDIYNILCMLLISFLLMELIYHRQLDKLKVLFVLKSPQAQEVYVAGEFNDWTKPGKKLKEGMGGKWSTMLRLKPGRYAYKFIVDGQWQTDPNCSETAPDGFGGVNSVMEVIGVS